MPYDLWVPSGSWRYREGGLQHHDATEFIGQFVLRMSSRSCGRTVMRLGCCPLCELHLCCGLSCGLLCSLQFTLHSVNTLPMASESGHLPCSHILIVTSLTQPWSFPYTSFISHLNTFLLVFGSGVAAHGIGECPASVDAAREFSKGFWPFSSPTSCVEEFCFSILTKLQDRETFYLSAKLLTASVRSISLPKHLSHANET